MNWNKYSLFKLPNRHRRFEYVPRYYDPKKEELKRKIREAERAAKREKGEVGMDVRREISFRQSTADKWGNTEFKNQAMRSNIRLIVIFAIVLIAFYFLYQSLADVGTWIDSQTGRK